MFLSFVFQLLRVLTFIIGRWWLSYLQAAQCYDAAATGRCLDRQFSFFHDWVERR